jgi:hypothetical protein
VDIHGLADSQISYLFNVLNVTELIGIRRRKMENQSSIKKLYYEIRKAARTEVIEELEKEAIKNKDIKTLEKLNKIKQEDSKVVI